MRAPPRLGTSGVAGLQAPPTTLGFLLVSPVGRGTALWNSGNLLVLAILSQLTSRSFHHRSLIGASLLYFLGEEGTAP